MLFAQRERRFRIHMLYSCGCNNMIHNKHTTYMHTHTYMRNTQHIHTHTHGLVLLAGSCRDFVFIFTQAGRVTVLVL